MPRNLKYNTFCNSLCKSSFKDFGTFPRDDHAPFSLDSHLDKKKIVSPPSQVPVVSVFSPALALRDDDVAPARFWHMYFFNDFYDRGFPSKRSEKTSRTADRSFTSLSDVLRAKLNYPLKCAEIFFWFFYKVLHYRNTYRNNFFEMCRIFYRVFCFSSIK